jgi:hypothetical protein
MRRRRRKMLQSTLVGGFGHVKVKGPVRLDATSVLSASNAKTETRGRAAGRLLRHKG